MELVSGFEHAPIVMIFDQEASSSANHQRIKLFENVPKIFTELTN